MTLPAPMTVEYLQAWGRHTHGSPLYAHLVELTAASPELMSVIQKIDHRPPPNVYFAAIQFLLMNGASDDLAEFYESLVDTPRPFSEVGPSFTEFVLTHQAEIIRLANTRYTQTNESRRCVALMPAIMTSPFNRFHVVDIGTSAGLNLAFDKYRYEIGDVVWGPESPVLLQAEAKGDQPRTRPVEVGSRIGIDLNVVNPTDPDDRRWLDALIWPEHGERRARLRTALAVAGEVETEFVGGSVLDVLDTVLSDLPGHEPVVVMNSFALIQLDAGQREEVASIVESARAHRPVYRVSLEFIDKADDWARLEVGSELEMVELGTAHPHGEWIDLEYQVLP